MWKEWSTADAGCPDAYRGYGSPTVLVNGEDVAPGPHPWAPQGEGHGPRCRIYREGNELLGAPPAARVAAAINRALGPSVG